MFGKLFFAIQFGVFTVGLLLGMAYENGLICDVRMYGAALGLIMSSVGLSIFGWFHRRCNERRSPPSEGTKTDTTRVIDIMPGPEDKSDRLPNAYELAAALYMNGGRPLSAKGVYRRLRQEGFTSHFSIHWVQRRLAELADAHPRVRLRRSRRHPRFSFQF